MSVIPALLNTCARGKCCGEGVSFKVEYLVPSPRLLRRDFDAPRLNPPRNDENLLRRAGAQRLRLLREVRLPALRQLIPIDLMGIEMRPIDAGEFRG